MEELMKEVRELREELRDKDRTITQLTRQQQVVSLQEGSVRQRQSLSASAFSSIIMQHITPGSVFLQIP